MIQNFNQNTGAGSLWSMAQLTTLRIHDILAAINRSIVEHDLTTTNKMLNALIPEVYPFLSFKERTEILKKRNAIIPLIDNWEKTKPRLENPGFQFHPQTKEAFTKLFTAIEELNLTLRCQLLGHGLLTKLSDDPNAVAFS